MEISGASILVAGATGGIGSAIAARLGEAGADLTLVGRNAARLDALDVPGKRLPLDLRAPDAAQSAVDQAIDSFGRLDGLVNAVGVVAFGDVVDLADETLDELFLTNFFAASYLARAATRAMSEGGVIVSISGVISEQNLPGMAAYGASKAALRSFGDGLAREARRRKIRVVDARPGHTETGLAGRAIAGSAPSFPTGLSPEHVAGVIVGAIADDGVSDLPSSVFQD